MLITIRVPQDTGKIYYAPTNNPYSTTEIALRDIIGIQQEHKFVCDTTVIKMKEESHGTADALEEA